MRLRKFSGFSSNSSSIISNIQISLISGIDFVKFGVYRFLDIIGVVLVSRVVREFIEIFIVTLQKEGMVSNQVGSRSIFRLSSQEIGLQQGFLGGVYKIVVYVFSKSKVNVFLQRQNRMLFEVLLRDLYSYVMGYFGRKVVGEY